jgi:predicted N-acetyltransferase YhbS
MRIEPLRDFQQLIPTIAEMLHLEWGRLAPWSSEATIAARFRGATGTERFPYCVIAVSESGEFMGTASVKLNEIPSHPDKQHWLGEVFVPKPLRGRGIATCLIEQIVEYSFASGARCVYLYTPDQQELYHRLGWQPCGEEVVNAEPVTIMVKCV